MAEIKEKDFVELEYTGKVKDTGMVFDTTDEKLAKEAGLHNPSMTYGPAVVCIGEGQLLEGLEAELKEKETGKEYQIELSPEKGFGKKDAKLIRMVPYGVFKKQNIEPEPGMQINMDGIVGTIKTASGGRCLVDFNHPLSGKELVYTVRPLRIVEDTEEKIRSYFQLALNLRDLSVDVRENKAEIISPKDVPEEIRKTIAEKLKEIVPSVKEYSFSVKKKEEK